MDSILNRYFVKDKDGYYYNREKNEFLLKGVASGDETRKNKAVAQAKLDTVPFSKVYSYINEFLELVRKANGFTDKNIKIDTIELDGTSYVVIDNGIIVNNNHWISPHWDGKAYDKYDSKYDIIKSRFNLDRASDILWFKFTCKGHLAVVANSCDINWKNDNSCGILVKEAGEEIDDSFVLIFPLTQDMLRSKAEPNSINRKYSTSELELAVGNYLIDKGVPIIDYFSHMGYKYNE